MQLTGMMLALAMASMPLWPCAADGLIEPSQGGVRALHILARLDPDMDRAIRLGEIRKPEAFAETLLSLMDLNGDGRLDLLEFQRSGGARRLAWFRKADANQDNVLSLAELRAAMDRPAKARLALQALDDNGDGRLSFAELRLGFPNSRPPTAAGPIPASRPAGKPAPAQPCCVPMAPGDSRTILVVPILGGGCDLH